MAGWESVIKKMDEAMDCAAYEGNTLDRTVFHGHQAICLGLAAILTELHKLRMQLKENA